MSGDDRPYQVDVLRDQNLVIVYGRDQEGAYTIPVKVWLCSTGGATPTGKYFMGYKREWGKLFGNVWGQYPIGITGDILFHSVPYEYMEKDSLETEEFNKLGTKASMGCIRLAVADVKWLYDNCPTGSPIHIYDAGALPEGVERPEPLLLDPEDPRSCWDPTDPDPENPWHVGTEDQQTPTGE
jgi:lipoprotein-anchoring transpeptidase ErfK/SrfK